jgi:hypothetical protein
VSSEQPPEQGWVLRRSRSSEKVVSILLRRFRSIADLLCQDEANYSYPFYVYDKFAVEVIKRIRDKSFMEEVGTFVDDLAESTDPLVRDVLVVSLLEGIASDAEAARVLKNVIRSDAKALLFDVEAKMYGRHS